MKNNIDRKTLKRFKKLYLSFARRYDKEGRHALDVFAEKGNINSSRKLLTVTGTENIDVAVPNDKPKKDGLHIHLFDTSTSRELKVIKLTAKDVLWMYKSAQSDAEPLIECFWDDSIDLGDNDHLVCFCTPRLSGITILE